ncbi:hypothetical protein [Bacteroides hominis]
MDFKTLLIMGLLSMFGLGSCANAEIGKQVIDLDNLNYNLDAAHYYAMAMDIHKIDLNDTAKREIIVFYKKDTLKYYNTESDELYPSLIYYNRTGGETIKEGTFCGFDFTGLNMGTTMDGQLAIVTGSARMNDVEFAKLKATIEKRYGNPYFEDEQSYGKPSPKWRWETKDEYIQLDATEMDGKGMLAIEITDESKEPVKMKNAEPYIAVGLVRWQKKYHDLVVINNPCSDVLLAEEREKREKLPVESAEYYTPEIIKPFLITTHYLDSLEQRGDVWGKIEASYYLRIPNSKIIDRTGVMDSVNVNQEGCLPVWDFGAFQRNFKDGMSNKAYIIRLIKQGKKLHDIMNDTKLCRKIYEGEAEWKDKKRFAGVIFLKEDEQGNITLPEDSKHTYFTLYKMALTIDDDVKEELKKSGLNLEKTTAHSITFPGASDPVAYFTDGEQERFMFIGNWYMETETRRWECNKVYSIIEYLEDTIRQYD